MIELAWGLTENEIGRSIISYRIINIVGNYESVTLFIYFVTQLWGGQSIECVGLFPTENARVVLVVVLGPSLTVLLASLVIIDSSKENMKAAKTETWRS